MRMAAEHIDPEVVLALIDPSQEIANLPNFEQGPAQGPNVPIKYYPGMGYGPDGTA